MITWKNSFSKKGFGQRNTMKNENEKQK